MSGWKCGASNYVLHVLGDDFFVADSVLHGADGAILIEGARDLGDGSARVDRLGGDNAVVAAWKLTRAGRGVEFRREIRRAGKTEAALVNGVNVVFPDVVSPDFGFALLREMSREKATDRAATDDADPEQFETPVKSEVKLKKQHQNGSSPLLLLQFDFLLLTSTFLSPPS
jgi:hypothetical protein